MLRGVIFFSLVAVWLGGACFGLTYSPNPSPWFLPLALALTAWGAGWLGIIFAAQIRIIRSLSQEVNRLRKEDTEGL